MTKQISKKGQRLFALLLAVAMLFSAMPMNAIAVTTNSDGYIEVSTIEDLYNIRNDLTANYILMNDIDLTDATAVGGDWDFMGNGWNPIGSNDIYGCEEFSGEFDGNGHKIVGMRIDVASLPSGIGTDLYLGLFAKVTGSVHDLSIDGGSVESIHSGYKHYAGAVAGYSIGKLNEIDTSISINVGHSGKTKHNVYVGGVVGYNNGDISGCSNNGDVYGVGAYADNVITDGFAYVGGICGFNTGYIALCYNTGSVKGAYKSIYSKGNNSFSQTGGIVGRSNGGVIAASYNAGEISGEYYYNGNTYVSYRYLGGIAGYLYDGAKVDECYSVGSFDTIDALTYGIGYLYGNNPNVADSTITNSYYLNGNNSTGSVSLTESQMRIQTMFKGFDFENTWVLNEFANYPYPQLQSNIQDLRESASFVSIIALPEKSEYMTGDKLNFTGAMVKVVYVSGKEEIIEITDAMVSGFDMNVAGEQTVTVTVAGASDTYIINVIERPVVESITIIALPDVTTFAVGTAFDFTGARAKVAYVGGITEEVDIIADMTTGGDINHIGKQTITYAFGGQSASFEVEVLGITLEKIVVAELPDKLNYIEGQELDLSGMVITAVMNNGFESTVSTGYTVNGYSSEPGDYTITVTYLGKTATFDVKVAKRSLISLVLNTLPDKLEYIAGQEFNENGLQVIATYDNGDIIVAEDYTISGFDNTPGIKNVVISMDGQSVSFTVKVIARVVTDFRLVSVPSKLDYIEYDAFDPAGLKVEATYNDGITEVVTDYELTGFSSEPGTHTITVAFEGFVKTFEINVTPRVLVDIKVKAPNKVAYYIGEEFDDTGMVVTACYNNGQEITVEDYQLSGFDSAASGAKTITITYGGISRSFAVAVQERSVIETGGNMIVGNLIGRLGETVVIPVNVTKNTGIAGFTHTINFDATALKLVSVDAVGGYADGTVILNDEKIANGEITVLWFGSADVKNDGVVYNLTFEILETARDGNTEITISFDDNDNGNISGENVIFGTMNGFVEVRSYWLGDLNGDRKYHMVDLLQLAQYVSGKEMNLTEKQLLSADVNEDTVIDIHDVIMLQQWIIAAGVPEA